MTLFTIAVTSSALEKGEDFTGMAFPFVKALNMVNQRLDDLGHANDGRFKIVLITTKSQEYKGTGDLIIDETYVITDEKTLLDHLNDLKPVLYLSTDSNSVRDAINAGYGAATMFQRAYTELSNDKLCVAFDGDGVLFSDESERVFKNKGLEAFLQNEVNLEDTVLKEGPLGKFAKALLFIQKRIPVELKCPIRTYLVTSRSTGSSAIRALKTLRSHGLGIDEGFFLSGAEKGPSLKAIQPHIFFDDQKKHVDEALDNGVVGAHVPFGVRNE